MSKLETDLERRALLGDQQAQRFCTQLQIPLQCPCCEGSTVWKSDTRQDGNCSYEVAWIECEKRGLRTQEIQVSDYYNGRKDPAVALSVWNRRYAPPVGRCDECINATSSQYFGQDCYWCDVNECHMEADDYCSYFEPKEKEAPHE